MVQITKRLCAAIAIVGFAAAFVAVGVTLSHAQDAKAPDLANLRDAVQAAAKRGNNVDEIAKAVDALGKTLSKGWTAPKPGATVEAPPELVAVRDAVETAARKGEKVDAIRTELEAVEKAMIGKNLTPPKPAPAPELPTPPRVAPFPPPQFENPFPVLPEFGNFPGGAVDRELLKKANELRQKALEMMRNNPNDLEQTQKLMQEAQQLMLKALVNGRGGLAMPGLMLPNGGVGRATDRFRLGIRMERLAEITSEQLGLEGRGVAVASVVPGSPAEKAGIKPRDIVLEFAGKKVSDNPEDLSNQVNDVKAGDKVDIVVLRKGKRVELKGVELPAAKEFPAPRLDARPLPLPGLGPVPAAPPLQLFPNPFQNGEGNSMSVTNVNGQVTIKARQDGVNYLMTGTQGDAGFTLDKLTITDGDKKPVEVKSLKDVPKEYKEIVDKMLKSVSPAKARQRD